jgi:hypothetical protein
MGGLVIGCSGNLHAEIEIHTALADQAISLVDSLKEMLAGASCPERVSA